MRIATSTVSSSITSQIDRLSTQQSTLQNEVSTGQNAVNGLTGAGQSYANAVSSNIDNALTGMGITSERIAGVNRQETATMIADFEMAKLDRGTLLLHKDFSARGGPIAR